MCVMMAFFFLIYLCDLSPDPMFCQRMHPITILFVILPHVYKVSTTLTTAAPGTLPKIKPNIAPAPAPNNRQTCVGCSTVEKLRLVFHCISRIFQFTCLRVSIFLQRCLQKCDLLEK